MTLPRANLTVVDDYKYHDEKRKQGGNVQHTHITENMRSWCIIIVVASDPKHKFKHEMIVK